MALLVLLSPCITATQTQKGGTLTKSPKTNLHRECNDNNLEHKNTKLVFTKSKCEITETNRVLTKFKCVLTNINRERKKFQSLLTTAPLGKKKILQGHKIFLRGHKLLLQGQILLLWQILYDRRETFFTKLFYFNHPQLTDGCLKDKKRIYWTF